MRGFREHERLRGASGGRFVPVSVQITAVSVIADRHAVSENQTQIIRRDGGVSVSIKIRIISRRTVHFQRKRVIGQPPQTRKFPGSGTVFIHTHAVSGVVEEIRIADKRLTGHPGRSGTPCHRRGKRQQIREIVIRRDGSTVGEGQIFVEFHGDPVILRSVGTVDHLFGMGFDGGFVPDILAGRVGFHHGVPGGEGSDVTVRRTGRSTSVAGKAEIAGQFGRVSEDDTVVHVRLRTGGKNQRYGKKEGKQFFHEVPPMIWSVKTIPGQDKNYTQNKKSVPRRKRRDKADKKFAQTLFH